MTEELGMRVSENKVLRKVSGPKVDEVSGDYRNLRSKELHGL